MTSISTQRVHLLLFSRSYKSHEWSYVYFVLVVNKEEIQRAFTFLPYGSSILNGMHGNYTMISSKNAVHGFMAAAKYQRHGYSYFKQE
ncbi:hypothetical protein K492DRAFT_171123 [Lichtheimia hyalospora FSU 10163]|nr:hypothetical protein K492DRAFT_171123 [Lichtheimia hyalospora FSU 10163]